MLHRLSQDGHWRFTFFENWITQLLLALCVWFAEIRCEKFHQKYHILEIR